MALPAVPSPALGAARVPFAPLTPDVPVFVISPITLSCFNVGGGRRAARRESPKNAAQRFSNDLKTAVPAAEMRAFEVLPIFQLPRFSRGSICEGFNWPRRRP